MVHSPRTTSAALPLILVAVLCALISAGCERADPLVAIRQQQAAGDYAGTIEPLRALLEERRDETEIQYLYGRALVFSGQPSAAEWSLRKAMEDPEWLVPAGMQLAHSALRSGNFSMAIEITTRLLEAQPDNVEVLLLRAKAHADSKLDNEAALADVARIHELDPGNLEAYGPRVLALLALERIDEARETIEELGKQIEATDAAPATRAWHCATTAIFADESGEKDLAAERWEHCLEEYPAQANVIDNALKFYDAKGDSARSLAILRAAREAEPDRRDFRLTLAERLRVAGENDEAAELLRAATETENAALATAAQIDLAKHLQEVEDYPAAARAVDRAVELARTLRDPPPQLLFEQADARVLAGELDGALAVTEEMTLPAHQAMIRARVAQERGQHAEALVQFDEAFRLWPDNPWAHFHAAQSAEALGDFDRATEEYRFTIRISPDATEARTRVAQLLLAEGRAAEALQLLRLKAEEMPLELEGELVSLQVWGWTGMSPMLGRSLEIFRTALPAEYGRAVASAVAGLRERVGPVETVGVLRKWASDGLVDFRDPVQAEALQAFVRVAHAAGVDEQAIDALRASVAARPDAAVFHALLGQALEFAGKAEAEVRPAYARALELEPENAQALAGLGRLALGSDPEAALTLFERAIAAAPKVPEAKLGAARALVAAGRPAVAQERLAQVLLDHPYEPAAAVQLAELQLEAGAVTDQTLALAERVVRFGGGAEAWDLVARVQRARNAPEAAAKAEARANELRQQAANG